MPTFEAADFYNLEELLTADERRSLDSVRSTLEGVPGVVIDRSYQLAVRAYRLDQHGRRRALSEDQVQGTLAAATDRRIRSIQGQAQTDFMDYAIIGDLVLITTEDLAVRQLAEQAQGTRVGGAEDVADLLAALRADDDLAAAREQGARRGGEFA